MKLGFHRFGWVVAALIGAAVIAHSFGLHILPPSHTGWMLTGTIGPDPVQYWLGYTFFKRSPWAWPPGLNPDWGIEIGSSVFYADSIPLLAFLFKALHPVVEVAQYWGLWIFACGMLQAVLAWKLIGLATSHPLPRIAGAALFALSPTMLNRLGGHFALGAHFLLLAGLYLCLTRAAPWLRFAQWAALILLASLIHSYLLPMVAGLWACDWLARATSRERRVPVLALEAVGAPGAGVFGLYLAGFFVLTGGFGGTWGGYGHMQLDLLAPFDPRPWGALLPDLPGPEHWETGHSYAGFGVLLALVQFADKQPGFARLDRYFPEGPAVAPLRLQDPFWTEAAQRHQRIRLTPTGMQARHWEEIAVYAATRGLATDAVYLARLDPAKVAALNARMAADLAAGRFERGSFYALGTEETLAAARAGMDPARDLLAPFDGIWVLAPGWLAR